MIFVVNLVVVMVAGDYKWVWDILFVSYCASVDGGQWSWWPVMVVSVNLWLFLNRKNERERINNVLYCK